MDIEDFKLEIKALQQKDTEDAINNGFNDKDSWFKYIINQEQDEVAQSIIDISKRYQVNENIVAINFDPTMLIRLSKVKNQTKKMTM